MGTPARHEALTLPPAAIEAIRDAYRNGAKVPALVKQWGVNRFAIRWIVGPAPRRPDHADRRRQRRPKLPPFGPPPQAPLCFDEDEPFTYRSMVDACRDCTADYQREMILDRRCKPPEWDVTPIGRLGQIEMEDD